MTKILLVDDEPDIVIVSKMVLEKEGYEVIVAKNGEQCMNMLEKDRPDLILLDIMLPGLDGWEICKKIKKDATTKDIPVVMFTVRVSEKSVERSLEYADAQIGKPFETVELLNTIKHLLNE